MVDGYSAIFFFFVVGNPIVSAESLNYNEIRFQNLEPVSSYLGDMTLT